MSPRGVWVALCASCQSRTASTPDLKSRHDALPTSPAMLSVTSVLQPWWLGIVDDPSPEEAKSCPSLAQFKAVATNRLIAVALRQGEKDVGGRSKLTVMQQCLEQAMFEADRQFLSSSMCVALRMDVRDLRLLVRFRAVDDNLRTKAGVLGIVPLPRTTATELQTRLQKLLSGFARTSVATMMPTCSAASYPGLNCWTWMLPQTSNAWLERCEEAC